MTSHFLRPSKAMGEAWFLGTPRVAYDWLLEKDVGEVPFGDLQSIFEEIASGLTCFGHADEWANWYGYLLPRSIPRAFEGDLEYLIENLVTAFMVVMPDAAVPFGYRSLREDALSTLGRSIMAPPLWPNGSRESTGCLHRCETVPTGYPLWGEASGDLSASMFFCLKYLTPGEIPGWARSVAAIECPRWRAQLLVWLCGAKGILDGTVSYPEELAESGSISIGWALSNVIGLENAAYDATEERPDQKAEFISKANRDLFNEVVGEIITERTLTDWLESLTEFPYIFDQIDATGVPERLRRLYHI